MKTAALLGVIAAAVAIGFGVYMIDVDQTQETRLPEVEIDGGQLPAFDAEVGSVEVVEEEMTVTVPGIEVTPPAETDENFASN